MTQRVRVYSPEGEPFDVPEHRLADLVLSKGFSQTPPDPAGVRLIEVADTRAAFVAADPIDESDEEDGEAYEGDEYGEGEEEDGDAEA